MQAQPFHYRTEQGLSFTKGVQQSRAIYLYQDPSGLTASAEIGFGEEAITYSDSISQVDILTPGEFDFVFSGVYPLNKWTPRIEVSFNQDRSASELALSLNRAFGQFEATWGLSRSRDFLGPTVINDGQTYVIEINKSLDALHQAYGIMLGSTSLTFSNDFSWRRNDPIIPSNALGLTLSPYLSSVSFVADYKLTSTKQIRFTASFVKDTLNTDIYDGTDITGALFAYDSELRTLGVSYHDPNFDLKYAYRSQEGVLNGYLLASPFGNWLTQISGARFYLQSDIRLSYHEMEVSWAGNLTKDLRLRLHNQLYFGTGSGRYRGYIWQLFDPISDLAIRELDLKIYSIDAVRIQLDYLIRPSIEANIHWARILPLYVDYELRGTSSSGDTGNSEFKLGAELQFGLSYTF